MRPANRDQPDMPAQASWNQAAGSLPKAEMDANEPVDVPCPGRSGSMTTGRTPRSTRWTAIEQPRIPAPTTTTGPFISASPPGARGRVGGQGLDVVGPLEGARVRDRALAEPAPELVEGLE